VRPSPHEPVRAAIPPADFRAIPAATPTAPATVAASAIAAANQRQPNPQRPEALAPRGYELTPDASLIDWEILPADASAPNVVTRVQLLDVTGGLASAASSPAQAAQLAAEKGVKYPFLRVEEELTLDGQGRVVAERVTREMIADEIIVKFPKGTPASAAASFGGQLGGVAAAEPFAEDTWLVAVPVSLRAVPEALESSTAATPYAEYVEPNFLLRPAAAPNDTRYADSWHWSRIDAPSAWSRRTSAQGVVVAVIDSGVRFTHEDLAANMWVNTGEIAGNGIDDDQNGYVDDVYGMDELDNDGNPSDGTGHGTHCAGLIGAVGNNGKGVTGAAWSGVQIMALRFIQEFGSVSDNVKCIDYAIAKGADIINASYGSTTFATTEAAAIYRAQQAGIVMVAAAGNSNNNNDVTPFYPASYTQYTDRGRTYFIENIISVGATTSSPTNEQRASFSNYGASSVDIFAPGVDIWSTRALNDTDYNLGSGTSFAAPIVAGVLALRKAGRPDDSIAQLISGILNGADSLGSLSGLAVTGGRLNANNVVIDAPAVLATAWHIPALNEALISKTMRDPNYEIARGASFTVYSGVRKFGNPYGTANQTGGTLFYRPGTNGAWSSNSLAFYSNNGDYQFWSAQVPGTATDGIVQYYLKLTFDSGVAGTNYIYGKDNDSTVTTDEAAAQAQPFSLRDRPSWVYHGNNRSVNGNNVTFTTELGYAALDASNNFVYRGADFGALYYTLDGTTPVGSQGNPGNTNTQVIFFTYQGLQRNESSAGDAMLWSAVLTNAPLFQNINYRIGFWNSANGDEQWGGYNTTNTNPVVTFSIGQVGAPQLTVFTPSNGSLNADYTTTKLYVDEIAGDSIPVTVTFAPNTSNVTAVELFSNLNQRDLANADADGDGIPDGIKPPSGDTVSVTNTNTYYRAYTMTDTGGGNYTASINATKTGAYRLTARYKTSSNTNWTYYTTDGRRDHAITVAPVQARDIRMYELNIFNIEASGKDFASRSTIEDLTDESNAIHTSPDRVNNFNLGYLQDLGVNWIWFQPYHPYGWEGRHESAANINARDPSAGANTKVWNGSSYVDDVNYPYQLGSPYAKRNFWEVEPRMSAAFSGNPANIADVTSSGNRATAMAAFQKFMAEADAAGINLMPDAAFNHSAWDVELGQAGVDYIMPGAGASGWTAADLIHDREVRVFSRKDDYAQRASYYNTFFDNNIAPAPDRGDFGKWLDVVDIFFGRYASLVSQNPSDNNNRLNEADTFDYSTSTGNFDGITRGVWRYFAHYAPYWLEKGRPAGQARNSTPADGDAAARYAFDARGIDGLRCDFGQGLPPQAWEYIINVARSYKWSFVFMSESLDGGAITYRSNRHFDILNENIVFPGKAANFTSDYRNIFEERRSAYGQGLVLLNTVSHDEDNYQDPWQAFIRYAVFGTVDGAPMIFPGQELGISNLYGYDLYEINFGKPVPHFKTYNSMMIAWGNDDYALNQLQPAYSAINAARSFSKALRSNNRFFLNRTSGGAHESIFSVAKYETRNASPASSDVVFGFVNLNRDAAQNETFNVAQDVDSNGVNDYGIKTGRKYNVKNIAAHLGQSPTRRDVFLWGAGLTGDEILSDGIYVALNAIPGSDAGAWSAAPYEALYLKLYDTTAPAAVSGGVSTSLEGSYAIAGSVTFSWSAVAPDVEGIVPKYRVNVALNNGPPTSRVVDGTSYAVSATADTKVDFTVEAVNPEDTTSASAATETKTFYLLTADGDYNGDGVNNAEDENPIFGKAPATVTLSDLVQAYTGAARSVTATTTPPGLTVNITYDGSATAPTEPGSYAVVATISSETYAGTANGTLTIHGPVPVADALLKYNNTDEIRVSSAELLANDTRVTTNGTVLTNSGLTLLSVANGPTGTATKRGDMITFAPTEATPETFTYAVTDGTSTNTGTVTVTFSDTNTNAPVVFSLQLAGMGDAAYDGTTTTVSHSFIAVPNQTIAVEYKGELSEPAWSAAGAKNSGASGSFTVDFSKVGNHVTDWNGSMFFRGYLTNTNQ
jgi:subtilisin family serine protease